MSVAFALHCNVLYKVITKDKAIMQTMVENKTQNVLKYVVRVLSKYGEQ